MTSRQGARRALTGVLAVVVVALCLALPAQAQTGDRARASVASDTSARGNDSFTTTKTVSRVFTNADGTQETVSSHDVTVRVDHTQNLRGRQRVRITWSGAHPSSGRASNPYGEKGLQQEYPMVIMQCRGTDDPALPAAKQVRPETCWTASVAQRSQVLRSSGEATWTHDLYADAADKQRVSGMDPFPTDECPNADIQGYYTHLTEFAAATGVTYPACTSDKMPPEAAVGAAFPPAEQAAFTDLDGRGSVQFEVRTDVENESLGCSHTVACSIVVVPIEGISCDEPAADPTLGDRSCRRLGRLAPGSSNFENNGIDQAVGPALWWSASNWRNRISVPVTFGLPPDACDVLDSRPPTGFYGSELLAQAGLQWSPAYCLNKKRFKFQLNRMSDIAAWDLMQGGQAAAAEVSSEHVPTAPEPVGYAPTAVSGFAVGYTIDKPDNAGEFGNLRLNARLIVKLLSQSYLASDLGRGHPGIEHNPLSIMSDPEFAALNPDLSHNDQEAAATVLSLSESSDVIEQLTEYIASDSDAMSFVHGTPDPWGMVINPSYKDIALPTPEWPLLDTYIPTTQNKCRQDNPTVYFTAVAAPVTTLRKISDALLDAWPNVQTKCDYDPTTNTYKIGRIDRQAYGARFMLGIVSLGDAARFGLRAAALETSPDKYVAPTEASLDRAIALTTQSAPRAPYVLKQDVVRKDGNAYPGTMVVYTAAKLSGLDQDTADKVAQFIRVSTTEGQVLGSGNGQLPEGYVPITRTGPTAKLYAQATDVAAAVAAQADSDGPPTPTPTDDPSDGTTGSPGGGSGGTSSGGGTSTTGGTDTAGGGTLPDSAPSDGATPSAGASTPPPVGGTQVVPTSATPSTSTGLASKLIPFLLLAALVGLAYNGASRFFVRMPRGPR